MSRKYITWLVSDTANGLTVALVAFGIPILVLMVTDEPAQAGIIGGIGVAVRAISALFGGVLADRHSRAALMLAGAVIGLLIAGGFTAAAVTGSLGFAVLLIVEVLLALRNGIFGMAGEAALKNVVPANAMGRAQGANQARDAILELLGAPLGGVLLAFGATLLGAVLLLCQVIAGLTAVLLYRLLPDHAAPSRTEQSETTSTARPIKKMITEVGEGFRWLFSRPDLRGVLAVATLINLGFSTAVTTVIYAIQQAGHSPAIVGMVSAGSGAALLIGALISSVLVVRIRTGTLVIAGLMALTGAVLLLPFVHPVPLTIAVLAVGLLPIPSVNAGLTGYFMVAVPDRLIGRANSAIALLATGAMPLAPLFAGFGLSWFGRTPTLIFSSAICLLAALLALAGRDLRSLPAEKEWAEHAATCSPDPDPDPDLTT